MQEKEKLKSLKVTELKAILAKASVPVPAKTNKQALIDLILANKAWEDQCPAPPPDDVSPPPKESSHSMICRASTTATSGKLLSSIASPQKSSPTSFDTTSMKPSSKAAANVSATPPSTSSLGARTVDPQSAVDVELEKRQARAARFGIPLVDCKAPEGDRATAVKPTILPDDPEKMKKRARRFAVDHSAAKKKRAIEVDPEELERRRKREKRFQEVPSES